jgi:hypothetical protein
MTGRSSPTKAEKAWITLAGAIIITDLVLIYQDEETMSKAFARWILVPRKKKICIVATVILILHLYEECPLPGQKSIKKIVKGVKGKNA